jgi:hypothetical protein
MSHGASPLAAFYLVGDRSQIRAEEAGLPGLVPALFSQYRDLSRIRHDFPVVLIDPPATAGWIKSLTDTFDDLLQELAPPGTAGEAMRRQVLALEQGIRDRIAEGQSGSLSGLWEAAQQQLTDGQTENDALIANLRQAREALSFDGEVVDCQDDLSAKLVTRAWHESEAIKAERLRYRMARLAQKLSDILQVDYMHSGDARAAGSLESAMGSDNQSVFDFQAMAQILRTAPAAQPLPEERRERIRSAIDVIQSQQFIALRSPSENPTYRFAFTDPGEAVTAYRERLPQMAALVKAISVAQLEIDNRYEPSRHDPFFGQFDEHRLGPADLAPFPSYLLIVEDRDESIFHAILDILRQGLPFKIVAQSGDILENDSIDGTRLSFGTRGQHLARMATGLDRVFVMRAAGSALYRMSDGVFRGLSGDEPALFSIFAGPGSNRPDATEAGGGYTPYLLGAAACEARVFPCLIYDPAAGPVQADRYRIDDNPQLQIDWPLHELHYENGDHNRQVQGLAFTPVDFIAADPRFSDRFACVPRGDWDDDMMPVDEFLALDDRRRASKVPYVLLADADGVLHRAVFDNHLVDAADRCRDSWRSLQELGGIRNSHAERALDAAQREWAAEKADLQASASRARATAAPAAAQPAEESPPPAASTAVAAEPPAAEEPAAPASDDPWIETIRCTTYNECTQINDRMFAYNADKRAYVADPDAGTFRELVEAAESCQVAIIHPGKPRNPNEPGLEELLARAEPFNT